MVRQAPSGQIHGLVARIVQLDKGVGHIVGCPGTDRKLVDLDGTDIPHLLDRSLGVALAGHRVGPGRLAHQIAVKGRRPGSHLEGRAHTLARGNHARDPGRGQGRHGPALGGVDSQGHAPHVPVRGIGEGHGRVLGLSRGKGLQARRRGHVRGRGNAHASHIVFRRHDIGLNLLTGLLTGEGPGRGHGRLVEGPLRTDAVIATVAQQDSPLLTHWVIAAAVVDDASAIVHHLQVTLLGIAAHGPPMLGLAVGRGRDKSPVDGGQVGTVLVIGRGIHTAHQVVLLVRHDPRPRLLAAVPARGIAVVGRFHGTITIVATVGLGIAVIKAAAVVVVMAADDPILSLGLVVHGRALGVVPTQPHPGLNENPVDLVPHDRHRGHVRDGHIVEPTHRRPTESAPRGLHQVVSHTGLIVERGNPAGSPRTEGILGRGIRVSAWVVRTGLDHADIQGLAVGLTHDLVERAVIRGVQRPRGTVSGHAWTAVSRIDIARTFRPSDIYLW